MPITTFMISRHSELDHVFKNVEGRLSDNLVIHGLSNTFDETTNVLLGYMAYIYTMRRY